jgi:hypothetical protein
MLTLFNRPASLKNLECSIVLSGTSMLSSETKYRAACILEILTGQKVTGGTCEVGQEDPLKKSITAEQQRDLDKVRGAALRQSMQAAAAKKAKGGGKPGANKSGGSISLTSDDLRKLGNGFKLNTVLEGVSMFHFLEKCREFYLPDVVGNHASVTEQQRSLPECGHPNHMKHSYVTGHFERLSPAQVTRKSLRPFDNPGLAATSYLLRSSDLLKFPDIELFFESMGSLVSREGSDDSTTLHLILRPTLRVESSPGNIEVEGLAEVNEDMGQLDNLKVMNYLLSQYFNAYMRRPRLSMNP